MAPNGGEVSIFEELSDLNNSRIGVEETGPKGDVNIFSSPGSEHYGNVDILVGGLLVSIGAENADMQNLQANFRVEEDLLKFSLFNGESKRIFYFEVDFAYKSGVRGRDRDRETFVTLALDPNSLGLDAEPVNGSFRIAGGNFVGVEPDDATKSLMTQGSQILRAHLISKDTQDEDY